jgi:mono/diheme cytochrome c family protein
MEWLYILIPFVLLGIGAIVLAARGPRGTVREAGRPRTSRAFRIVMLVTYVALGLAVPAAVIAGRDESEGGVGPLEQTALTPTDAEGKRLFKRTCASCHNLDAVNARGVTGPDLDTIGQVSKERVANAIENGGTGQKRMPAALLEGPDADAVASYVSKVAGR